MLCPLDSRYREKVQHLDRYFSDEAYYRYRMQAEVLYLALLLRILPGTGLADHFGILPEDAEDLRRAAITTSDYERALEIEKQTLHDVKAIEYTLAERFPRWKSLIHFGLTSQDINSVALSWMVKEGLRSILEGELAALESVLQQLIQDDCAGLTMVTFTHGQPAVFSDLGKEMHVYLYRLQEERGRLRTALHELRAKFGGAIGNLNALYYAVPSVNWMQVFDEFLLSEMQLRRSQFTTQIDDYDSLSACLDSIKRLAVICNTVGKNMWLYISKGYFQQRVVGKEVGSSTMPHKVNPIFFENAMGNAEMLTGLLEALTRSVPNSTLQRDLKDSTLLRNVGMVAGYTSLILQSLAEGFRRVTPDRARIAAEVDSNAMVLTEAIQTYLRLKGYPDPYELCKDLTRGRTSMTRKELQEMIQGLPIQLEDQRHLETLSPASYRGVWPDMKLS